MTVLAEPIPTTAFEPQPWQEKDLRYLAPMPYSANWSQMGCYKTSTGLWLLEKKRIRNAIIVTSKLGKGAFFSDFYKCLPEEWSLYNLAIHEIENVQTGEMEHIDLVLDMIARGAHDHPIVILTHYDVFTNRADKSSRKRNGEGPSTLDKLKKIEWDMIWCDEAHRLKNKKTQWTVNIKKLKSKNRHISTGTAFVNNPAEMYSLLNFLNKKEWSNYWAFRNYFCDQVQIPQGGYYIIRGILPYRLEEFRRLRQRLGPRHLMSTVHKGITKPIERTYKVELNATQRRMYKEIKDTLQTMDKDGQILQSPNVLSQLNRLRQISVATPKVLSRKYDPTQRRIVYEIELEEPSSKLDQVMEILDELDDPSQKVVIFSAFKDPLKLLAKRLDEKRIGYIHMEQKHSEQERYRLWHDEFRKPENKIFMSTLSLGGESINLSCAQYLIFLDRSWSPKDMMQAIGRVYRPGQEGGVEVIYLDATKTVDSYVFKKLELKTGWFNQIFGD